MSDNTDAEILRLLLEHLKDTNFEDPKIRISLPAVKFTPDVDHAYVAARYLPNKTETPFIGVASSAVFTGELRVTVHAPALRGEFYARELAAKLICHFKRGTRLEGCELLVRINHRPWQANAFTAADRVSIPVSIPYYSTKSYKEIDL
ncbi:phage tail terminator-like protein [Pseudochrobactrum sp. MP213Fo]|uniref:phage tail terminator-like protein n=1 Tax=Pseudochrobactrum sp. MP213Fo TaxID=3022250 RepID=UPI003BA2C74A